MSERDCHQVTIAGDSLVTGYPLQWQWFSADCHQEWGARVRAGESIYIHHTHIHTHMVTTGANTLHINNLPCHHSLVTDGDARG